MFESIYVYISQTNIRSSSDYRFRQLLQNSETTGFGISCYNNADLNPSTEFSNDHYIRFLCRS